MKWTWLGALGLAAVTVPLQAEVQAPVANCDKQSANEEAATDTDPVRPLEGMDAAQILAFFDLISATDEFEALLARAIATMLEPGEAVPGWRESGVDILAELGARDGGVAGNLLRDDDTEVLSITDLSGTVTPDLSGFTRVRLRAAPPGGASQTVYASFAPGVWMVLEMQPGRRGNAFCYTGLNGITLYSREPLSAWDEETTYLMAGMVATFDRVAAREVCVVYQREGNAFAARSYLPDGRSLPQINAESTLLRIMPANGLSAFMRDAVPALPASPAE